MFKFLVLNPLISMFVNTIQTFNFDTRHYEIPRGRFFFLHAKMHNRSFTPNDHLWIALTELSV